MVKRVQKGRMIVSCFLDAAEGNGKESAEAKTARNALPNAASVADIVRALKAKAKFT